MARTLTEAEKKMNAARNAQGAALLASQKAGTYKPPTPTSAKTYADNVASQGTTLGRSGSRASDPIYTGKVSATYVPGTLGNQKVGSSSGGTSSGGGDTGGGGGGGGGTDLGGGSLDTTMQDYYADLLADLLAEQQKAAQLRTQAALAANNAFIPQVNQLADQRLQDSYIAREMARVNMPQQLSAAGISGGAAETTLLGLDTNYQNNRNSIEQDREQALGEIRRNAQQIEATGNADLADLAANYYQNLVNKQMRDQENALTQSRWQTEFDADRADTAYNNKLRLAQYMAELGDYSGLRELGISVNALNDMNGSTPMTKAAPAKVTATTPTSSGNYNTVLNNVKRALGGSNAGSQMSWNAAVNYIQNSLKNGIITEYEAQQMLGQLGLD